MMYKSRILAMILGGLPREKDIEGNDIKTEKEHYIYIYIMEEEHKSIVKEWIDVFGRLPQTFPSSDPPEPQHEVWPNDLVTRLYPPRLCSLKTQEAVI